LHLFYRMVALKHQIITGAIYAFHNNNINHASER